MAQRCSEYVGQKGIVEMPKEQTDAPVKFYALDRLHGLERLDCYKVHDKILPS